MHKFTYVQYSQLKGLEASDEEKYTSELEEMNQKSMADLYAEFGKEVLTMFTVVDLKEELKERKLSTAGKKSEMVDRLDELYAKEGSSKKRKSDESDSSEKKQKTESETMDVDLEGKNPGNVIGGYKATLKNPNASEEAKEHAQQALDQLEGNVETKADKKTSEEVDLSGKNKGNVIGGYKATLNNPNVSDEAKEHAKEALDQLGEDTETKSKSREVSTRGKDLTHVIGGYKATLSNANSSQEAKDHALKVLKEFGVDPEERLAEKDYSSDEVDTDGKDLTHVIGGYKATLSNANSSEEAKDHARRVLEEFGVDASEKAEEKYYHSTKITKRNMNHVIGGYKATLTNENSSEEAKDHARKVLKEFGVDPEEKAEVDYKDKDMSHVIGGYKAALHNANSSEEAKSHARKMLKELGASEEPLRQESSHETTIDGKNIGNVIGGYKAALHNENVSEEAKQDAKAHLAELGVKNPQ